MEFSLKHTRKLIGTSLFQSKKKKKRAAASFLIPRSCLSGNNTANIGPNLPAPVAVYE